MPRCRIALVSIAALLACADPCGAQIQQNAPVNVLGQVYMPGGGPVQQPVRVDFSDDGGVRPPESIYTDSNGRFVIYRLAQGHTYYLTVQANEPNWGTTVVPFTPLGRHPSVQIYLNPFKRPKLSGKDPSVSAATLRSEIPGKARREFERGMEQVVKGETGRAQEHFEKAIRLYPPFVEARNELAVALMKRGNLKAAEEQLRKALETDSAAVMPLMNLGLCIYRQGKYMEAAEPLERATQLQPENYRGHLLLGMVWVMSGDDPRSEHTLLRAYELGGTKAARAQFYLSHYYTRKKSYAKAARALEIYLTDNPSDPAAPELHKTLDRLRATIARN